MASVADIQPEAHPSTPDSETHYASNTQLNPSDLTDSTTPVTIPQPNPHENQHRPNPRPKNPTYSQLSQTQSATARSRAYSTASTSSVNSVRRKPLPVSASPLATRFSTRYSTAEYFSPSIEELPEPDLPYSRYTNVADSPTLYEFPSDIKSALPFSPESSSNRNSIRSSIRSSRSSKSSKSSKSVSKQERPSSKRFSSEQIAWTSVTPALPEQPTDNEEQILSPKSPNLLVPSHTRPPGASRHERLVSDSPLSSDSESTGHWYGDSSPGSRPGSATMSIFSSKATPPHNIIPNAPARTYTHESHDSTSTIHKPKSPGKLGSFFSSWGGAVSPSSSTTTFSEDKADYSPNSPIPSSNASPHKLSEFEDSHSRTHTKAPPAAIDIPKANADAAHYFENAYLQIPIATPSPPPLLVEEMERELKEISQELASSIRREMDLEDLVDRLQLEAQNSGTNSSKRTSDYFSDSGTSVIPRYGEPDPKQDELDRIQRKTEQEKASIKLELTDKLQDERAIRKQLETQIRSLEERAAQVDLAAINSVDANGRLKELEATCEDLRRKLSEEKQIRENFEDLLTALKADLETSHNERDNLRDEIVPQLKARVEGLEAQAAEHEKLTYEQSKMNQEIQILKKENTTLINAQRLQMEMNQFNSLSEEDNISNLPRSRSSIMSIGGIGGLGGLSGGLGGLKRANSLAHTGKTARSPGLSRTTSVKTAESREALAERVKDIELQRDSLHRALKKIRQLEMERDRAMNQSPRRQGYDKEVSNLREEINTLRRRADEAIEQKWQCEKGLGGLKMDLDRAEQEIGSLRSLLQEKDILIKRSSTDSRPGSSHATSETLERSYRDLQAAYSASLERIKALEISASSDEDTARAMEQLEKSLSDAITERDVVKQELEAVREQSESLRDSEKVHLQEEMQLADELRESARRVEELAGQVRLQLASNSTLRQRLADAIERGEKEQKANAQKITFLQTKLRALEEKLIAAQNISEVRIARHEDEIRDITDSHNIQLLRVKSELRSPRSFGPKSPMSPLFANAKKVPRLSITTSGKGMSVSEDSKVEVLRQQVVNLEAALAEADREMEEVVGRMNIAQIEVMELQNEREEAVRETRKLQKTIEQERLRAFEGRFATLNSSS
ncbi:putative intracellular protein transport-like protein [Botrytis fragariae]|uniref:Putative intracellular protein transport-like protein n=1 Tax=Botrytis fragariae TaxID=1964551 RepID=A0A8H6AMY6_9HELO|nr:putative intracellular protein transport-like protein [Botrytis fragariae]KAF5870190.1 putative intracellular protein transport-like protein [Botrytis fragariae]